MVGKSPESRGGGEGGHGPQKSDCCASTVLGLALASRRRQGLEQARQRAGPRDVEPEKWTQERAAEAKGCLGQEKSGAFFFLLGLTWQNTGEKLPKGRFRCDKNFLVI